MRFSKKRQKLTRTQQPVQTQSETQEVSITKMLLAIVLVFFLCNLPKTIQYIAGTVKQTGLITNVANFLVIINSAFNFVVYFLFSKQFRDPVICLLRHGKFSEKQTASNSIRSRTFQIESSGRRH